MSADVTSLTERLEASAADPSSAASPVSTFTALPALLTTARRSEAALGTPVLLTVLQLVLLCGLVLVGAVRGAAEARGPEIALAQLRRLPAAQVLLFALAEPLLIIPLALPIGLVVGWLATRSLAAGGLLPGTPVALTGEAVLAGAVGVVAAAGAAVVIGLRIVRRPPAAQWRRAERRPRLRPWWIDGVVIALAAAAVVLLGRSGGLTDRGGDTGSAASPVSLVAPALLALAVALVGSRALSGTAAGLYEATRRRSLSAYLAVRQIARRPTVLGSTVLLTIALALAAFGVSASTVAGRNAQAVAGTEVGAAETVTVTVPPGVDLDAVVDEADPGGRSAMAVTSYRSASADHRVLVGVQPSRFAAVAYWRGRFAGGRTAADIARAITVPGLHPVTVTGAQVAVDLAYAPAAGSEGAALAVTVQQPSGPVQVVGPALTVGRHRVVLDISGCTAGCPLAAVGLVRKPAGTGRLAGSLVVAGLAERPGRSGAWNAVPGALRGGAAGWRVDTGMGTGRLSETGGLRDDYDLAWPGLPSLVPHDHPVSLPAVVSFPLSSTASTTVDGLDGRPLQITPVVVATAVPYGADLGAVVDGQVAARSALGLYDATRQVWLTADADPAILTRTATAGVELGTRQTAGATRAGFSRQGPPLALALLRAGAVLAAVLALVGTALALALVGRRRAFELTALSVLGLSRRTLLRSLALEQVTLLGFGSVLGIATGLMAARVALPSVPEFVDIPAAPPLVFTPPYALVAGLAVALAVVVVGGAVLGTALLVRSVHADRLREAVP